MIKSLSRLVRQFVGARPLPASEALTEGVDAERSAQDAALARENLKRAMEAAFAAPSDAEPPRLEEPARPLAAQEWTIVMIDADVPAPAVAHLEQMLTESERVEANAADRLELGELVEDEIVEESASVETADVSVSVADDVIELEPVFAEAPEPSVEPDAAADDVEAVAAEAEAAAAVAQDVTSDADVAVAEQVVTESSVEAPAAEASIYEAEAVAEAAKPARAKKGAAKKKKAPAKKKSTKKASAPKAGAALPEDAVWVSDAVNYSLTGEWVQPWYPPEDSAGFERLKEVCAKAAEGALAFWGRVDGTDRWEPIKAAFWKTGFVEPLSFVMGRENLETDAKTTSGKPKKAAKYHGLKVSKAEVEALWPAAEPEVRNAA